MVVPSKVLYVDLSRRRFWTEDWGDLFEAYLGGASVGIRLLMDECPKGVDPLDPDNPIIFVVGPLTGLYPLASKTVAFFKSPLTGNLGESYAGGRSAVSIRLAGYGAIVIRGASKTPVYLAIHGRRVHFRDASGIWGMRSTYTVGRIIRELEPGAGLRTIMRIGVAGEKLVRYANVVTETYRHFGRLGLGAVFGSKKLKAIIVSGRSGIPVRNPKEFRKVYREIYEKAVTTSLMRKYYELGTSMNIMPLNELGALPTRNLRDARFEMGSNLSGEELARRFLGRRVACSHCPVACIHLAALREPYPDEPYFYKTTMIPYDYEPLYALGSMLGIGDVEGWLRLMDEVESLGLDAMSTGVALAWATEAYERGLIGPEETLGVELSWGRVDAYIQAVRMVVKRTNEFYRTLGMGVEKASEVYGGREFALAFGGLEMPGYHTGPLAYVGFMTGGRHSHLDSAGYSYDQKFVGKGLPDPEEAGRLIFREEAWRQVLNSLVVCLFARKIYDAETVSKALKAVGVERSPEELEKLGVSTLRLRHEFKAREGFDPRGLRIPRRILETRSPHGRIDPEYLRKAVETYFRETGTSDGLG